MKRSTRKVAVLKRQTARRKRAVLWLLPAWLLSLFLAATSCHAEAGKPAPEALPAVQYQGHVVCVAEEMHRRYGTELPTGHQHIWGFKASDGKCYTLLEGKFSEAIFKDPRVRAKELRIKARLLPGSQVLEMTYFRSVKDGVVQDLYYYCEVCAIKTVSPEICACCQSPVELIEKPASGED
jgi:hypothetical protein